MTEDQWPAPKPPVPEKPQPSRSPATPVVALALIGSLLVNGLLAVRFREAEDDRAALRAELAQREREVELLRGRIRGDESGSPLARIANAVAQLRGLAFKETVRPDLLSSAALRKRIEKSFLEETIRKEVEGSEKVLKALGLIGDIDLYQTLKRVQLDQIAGFYDSENDQLVIGASDAAEPSSYDRVVLAHEYTHALTDQHFDLTRLDRLQDRDRDEEAAAYLALIEGDAQFVMSIYRDEILTKDEREELIRDAGRIDQGSFTSLPPFLQQAFTFPYEAGLNFVATLHRQGGFALIDEAYRDPPVSTEQILHPEKYTRAKRDEPTKVTLPNLAAAMGRGARLIEEGDIGELDLKLLADTSVGRNLGSTESAKAAAGWGGGRYAGVTTDDGTVVAVLTTWDSTSEAREATRTFGRWLEARYPNGTPQQAGTGRGWGSAAGAGAVVRVDKQMLLIVGPNPGTVDRARGAFDGF